MIQRVTKTSEIQTVEKLANKIWNSHYVPIIGQNQVNYMLEKFQSFNAIKEQINNNYEYFLIFKNKKAVGYLCLLPDNLSKKIMISKIYINENNRGSGFGKQLIDFTINLAQNRKIKTIWLTVNKNNNNSINWYKKLNFKITEKVEMDIGNGYVMDDYVMELTI